MADQLSREDIKRDYPDEWVILVVQAPRQADHRQGSQLWPAG